MGNKAWGVGGRPKGATGGTPGLATRAAAGNPPDPGLAESSEFAEKNFDPAAAECYDEPFPPEPGQAESGGGASVAVSIPNDQIHP